MKKKRIITIVTVVTILLACFVGYLLYSSIVKETTLTIKEKKWIDNNTANVISLSVPNDISIFGVSGSGVFFDFNNYLKDEVGLNINNNTTSYKNTIFEYGYQITTNYLKDGLLLYKDHFVLVSKNNSITNADTNIINLGAGVLNTNLDYVSKYYNTKSDSFTGYDSYSSITTALNKGELVYALVSLNEYKEEILKNNYNILLHVSDLNKYYYFMLGDNDTLNSILRKKYEEWMNEYYEESYNKHNYKLFISSLNISAKDEDTLTNQDYNYGFNETSTYEVLASGVYGGITAEYLNGFSKFANVTFTYKRYKNSSELVDAVLKGEIDLYYNYYNILTNYIDDGALKEINYYVIADNSVDLSMSNINGLQYQTVYVQKDTYLYDLIKDITGIKIVTYDTTRDLKKILNKKCILVVDSNIYDYYINSINNNYSIRYKGILSDNYYSFKYKNDTDTFYTLLNAYTKTIDPSDILRKGINSYNSVSNKRTNISRIVMILIGLSVIAISMLIHKHKKSKTVKIDTKVKKEDRLKYIDLLTSLKNRNYYNEKVNVWNKNTIYPQTCIVLDINKVKDLNDTLGHEEGDKQIRAVANILIKTQIDSTEIMRTDGNEFFIYMVGYSEKQVVSYMKKLIKEFDKLPHDTGVAMGFSMILDDTVLVEDAFNEASIKMRENKELSNEQD